MLLDQVDGRSPDGGSYGQVFPSRCGNGRACAIKVYRKRDGSDDATHEVAMYHKLGQLTQSQQRWFPEMLNADVNGVPFPWVALSFEGASLVECQWCVSRPCMARLACFTWTSSQGISYGAHSLLKSRSVTLALQRCLRRAWWNSQGTMNTFPFLTGHRSFGT